MEDSWKIIVSSVKFGKNQDFFSYELWKQNIDILARSSKSHINKDKNNEKGEAKDIFTFQNN